MLSIILSIYNSAVILKVLQQLDYDALIEVIEQTEACISLGYLNYFNIIHTNYMLYIICYYYIVIA